MLLAVNTRADSLYRAGELSMALPLYVADSRENPLAWWPAYRAAWLLNRLDMPDSALVWAIHAHGLRPGSEAVLGELLRACSGSPEAVLGYGGLVAGGGVCRFRLAQAERRLESPGVHTAFLEEMLQSGSDSARADAACWLSLLFPDRSLELMELAVALEPGEEFYRTVLAGELASAGLPERGFQVLEPVIPQGYYYWQAVAACHEAEGTADAAAAAFRNAFMCRRCPAAAAELGWFLYRTGRSMMRSDDCQGAVAYLSEAAGLWHADSSWAAASESLLVIADEFLRAESGWGRLR